MECRRRLDEEVSLFLMPCIPSGAAVRKTVLQSAPRSAMRSFLRARERKKDYNHFTRLINIENRKIDKKVQEMKNIQLKISEYQKKVKSKRENYEILMREVRTKEDEIQSKID